LRVLQNQRRFDDASVASGICMVFLVARLVMNYLAMIPTLSPNSAAQVAKLAGVSISTVSRVVNSHPSVSDRTAQAVQQAIRTLDFKPARRPRVVRRAVPTARDVRIAFVMFGASNASPAPSFQRLLYGVSKGADALGVNLAFTYLAADVESSKALEQNIHGLLLHGLEPKTQLVHRLRSLPTVWLMGNRSRPTWGDQVMPDNTGIGMLAANYLLKRGHRRLAYLGLGGWSWSFGIRALAFSQIGQDHGVPVEQIVAHTGDARDYWDGDLLRAAGDMVDKLLELPQRPTGLFVSEDRLLPVVQASLIERNIPIAAPTDLQRSPDAIEIISCNNDARFLPLRGPVPPSVDIGAEAIGRRGIEHLLWRITNPHRTERFRMMIAPTLIDSE
jgi:LacI family transcriptional regulator